MIAGLLSSLLRTELHFAGDELLARTGSAITAVSRSQDVAARVGGDEFALLAVECDSAAAATLVSRLRRAGTNEAEAAGRSD